MKTSNSVINQNTITMFVAAFIGTLMAVFVASAIAPNNGTPIAHTQPVKTVAAAADHSNTDIDSCETTANKTSQQAKTVVKNTRSVHNHSHHSHKHNRHTHKKVVKNSITNNVNNNVQTGNVGVNTNTTFRELVNVNVNNVGNTQNIVSPITNTSNTLNNIASNNTLSNSSLIPGLNNNLVSL